MNASTGFFKPFPFYPLVTNLFGGVSSTATQSYVSKKHTDTAATFTWEPMVSPTNGKTSYANWTSGSSGSDNSNTTKYR
jgi:hypothetical protein